MNFFNTFLIIICISTLSIHQGFCSDSTASEPDSLNTDLTKFVSITSGWNLGFGLGSGFYYGDIKNYKYIPGNDKVRSGSRRFVSYFLEKSIYEGLGLRFSFHKGGLKGSNKYVVKEYFDRFYEKTGHNGAIDFVLLEHGFKKQEVIKTHFLANYNTWDFTITLDDQFLLGERDFLKKFGLSLRIGVGLIYFRTYQWFQKVENENEVFVQNTNRIYYAVGYEVTRELKRDGVIYDQITEKTAAYRAITFPVGLLMFYHPTDRLALGVDFNFINTNTDKLDTAIDYSSTDKFLNLSANLVYRIF